MTLFEMCSFSRFVLYFSQENEVTIFVNDKEYRIDTLELCFCFQTQILLGKKSTELAFGNTKLAIQIDSNFKETFKEALEHGPL